MSSVALIVLSGLPGSGKSTLCEKLCSGSKDFMYVHLNFDELIPRDVEKELIESTASEKWKWKSYRAFVKKLVSWKLSGLVTSETENSEDVVAEIPDELVQSFGAVWPGKSTAEKCVVLVDDNMYYRSMRYEYFQLARQYSIGFGQVFFDCPVQQALERNSQRRGDKMVAKDVIETMATRLEAPSVDEWEKYSFVIDGDNFGNFHSLSEFFRCVMENPVEPIQEVDPEMQQQSRVACSESVIYQTDQILRKLISEHMVVVKGQKLDKTGLKSEGLKVNAVRTGIIADMKKQQILVESSVVENSVDAALNKSSPLYEYIRDLFESRLQ